MDRRHHARLLEPDPATGKRRILQKSISLGKCTRVEARAKREELLVALRKDEAVLPSKRTLGDWLRTWLNESVRPALRQNSIDSYTSVITKHVEPALGGIRLQDLRAGHLAKYYADKASTGLSGASLSIHHSVISSALKSAVRQGLLTRNVAPLVDAKPRAAGRGRRCRSTDGDHDHGPGDQRSPSDVAFVMAPSR